MARIDDARAFLNDPTRVRLYTEDERRATHDAEEVRLCRTFPSGRFAHKRIAYVVRSDAERTAELERLARRYASTDYCGPSHLDAHADDAFRADLLLAKWRHEGLIP